jgi:hypothetical protein
MGSSACCPQVGQVIVVVSIILAAPWSAPLPNAESLERLDVYGALLAALCQSPIHHDRGHTLYTVLPSFRLRGLGLHIVDLQVAAFADDAANRLHRLITDRTPRRKDLHGTLCHFISPY